MTEPEIQPSNPPEPQAPAAKDWPELEDKDLLQIRICDLGLKLEGSDAEPLVQKFVGELEGKGLVFRPVCYLTTEWLTPDKVPLIGLPFCLAHPRLRQLEKSMMLEVEGGTEAAALRLLRHEAGHAINYAYQFYRRSRWRELFGPFTLEYNVADYYPRPFSRQFVIHLEDNYAQAHPDEDFAETFAVWMTPGLDWRTKYKGWGALRKLEYVDHLMKTDGVKPPPIRSGPKLWPVHKIKSTLESYYKKKRVDFAHGYPGYYDPDLKKLFAAGPTEGCTPAAQFLARHRKTLTIHVARWAHVPKFSVDQLIRRLERRAKDLALHTQGPEQESILPVSTYLTALACERRKTDSN